MTRDEFLTEKMGECWHKWRTETQKKGYVRNVCLKCGIIQGDGDYPNFSTWEGFGKLWEWAKKQKWWLQFIEKGCYYKRPYMHDIVNPNKFANAVAEYLGYKE